MAIFKLNRTAPRTRANPIALAALLATALVALSSCSRQEPKAPKQSERAGASPPPAAVKLTVLVAGDEALAEGARLLSGEWKARSGGDLAVATVTLEELAAADELSADVVIFPSRWLGALAERGALRPMRESVLTSPQLALNDIFPAIRNGEMRYGGQTMALPLGSPPLLMYWRPALAGEEPSRTSPPQSWEAYRQWIGAGSAEVKPTTAPLAGRAAAYTLVARALAYVESPRRPEAMFNPETMTPRITDPPWARALVEIIEETPESTRTEPAGFAAAIAAVRSGQSLATLGWPGVSGDPDGATADAAEGAEFAPLPTATDVFSETRQAWENQLRPQSVTLLGVQGRLIAVTQSTRNAVSAFALCQWLASGNVAVQLSSRSDATLWYRKSQAASYGRWLEEKPRSSDATPVTQVAADALETQTPVMIPRVPSIDEYLNALAEAVRSAKPGEAAATEALAAAAAKWEAITERLGRDAQTRAYQRHLGIESFDAK